MITSANRQIAYWAELCKQPQFGLLDESMQTLLSKLIRTFGEEFVISHNVDMKQQHFEKLYKMLNVALFDNRLDAIPVKYMDIGTIIDEWHKQDKAEGIPYQDYSDKRKSYGFYINIGDADESLPDDKRIFSLKYRDHCIYVNSSKCYRHSSSIPQCYAMR